MFNGSGNDRVGDTSKGTGKVVLCIRKTGVERGLFQVLLFKISSCLVEGTELDAHLLMIRGGRKNLGIDLHRLQFQSMGSKYPCRRREVLHS